MPSDLKSFDAPAAFEERLSQRLSALASAHDVLARQEWRGADLDSVLKGQLRHHLDTYGDRIEVVGEPCDLPPEAAHYVGLALHELGSNAVKHGALAAPNGKVTIAWRVRREPDGDSLELSWIESGAGPVVAPERTGFGAVMLRSLVASAVKGRAEMIFGESGLTWTLTAPLTAPGAA